MDKINKNGKIDGLRELSIFLNCPQITTVKIVNLGIFPCHWIGPHFNEKTNSTEIFLFYKNEVMKGLVKYIIKE